VDESNARARVTAPPQPISGRRLDSWKEIAGYLNRNIRTVQRWEEAEGLPVYRLAQKRLKGSPVYAFTTEIDAWLHRNPSSTVSQDSVPRPAVQTTWKGKRIVVAILSIAILAAGIAVVWRILQRKPIPNPLRVVQLTSYAGMERYPAISPDGKQVVFSWNGENQDNFDLYVKIIDGGNPHRLTKHPGVDGWPAWSPDGRTIAFVRWVLGSSNPELLTVEALEGRERRILTLPSIPRSASYWPILCWAADGEWIIASVPLHEDVPASIAMISNKTLEIRSLTEPLAGSLGDCCPAIAPDNSKLAFLRASADQRWNLFILELASDHRPVGKPKQLTDELSGVQNPVWTADNRELLYVTDRNGERTLWRVPYDHSRPATPIGSLGAIGYHLAISPHGDRLVYSNRKMDRDIWRANLPDCRQVKSIVSTSAFEFYPEIAPDGKRIAYISDRGHGTGLWVSGVDGANPIHLASLDGRAQGPARWSPDGKNIAFDCRYDAGDDICIVPSSGGAVRRLTRDPAHDTNPSWSHDGKWIYFSSNRSGLFQIWKMPALGSDSAAIKLTEGGGRFPVESADGTTVFFVSEEGSISSWKTTNTGGSESPVGEFHVLGSKAHNFAVTGQGIYYVSSTEPESWFEIWMYRFSNGRAELISRINNKRIWEGLSVAPDGLWLAFNASEPQGGDLYMVDNFR